MAMNPRPTSALALLIAGFLHLCSTVLSTSASAAHSEAETLTIRVGHFPNVTHVQALVARNFERQGRDWFIPRLGPGVRIEWYAYNAGPSAMEAIFAGIGGGKKIPS